jgi:signal transduction histidine kinase
LLQPDELTTREQQLAQIISHTLAQGKVWRGEARVRRKDGSDLIGGVTMTPTPDQRGVVVVLRDISVAKKLQEQKARFFKRAAHELRSPLSSLNTRLYMLRRQPDKLDYHASQLEAIGKRLNLLVEDLLDLGRTEDGRIALRPQDTILQDIILQAVETHLPQAQLQQVDLSHDLPFDPLHSHADPNRLMQVLTNLITNALHYTPAEGKIQVTLSAEKAQQTVLICVEDTGKGIAEENLEEIFQPFFRVSEDVKGTGLGLSIAREIIDAHGGQIWVEPALGEGSCFKIRLPLTPVDPA